jgi:hypothetical protein
MPPSGTPQVMHSEVSLQDHKKSRGLRHQPWAVICDPKRRALCEYLG